VPSLQIIFQIWTKSKRLVKIFASLFTNVVMGFLVRPLAKVVKMLKSKMKLVRPRKNYKPCAEQGWLVGLNPLNFQLKRLLCV